MILYTDKTEIFECNVSVDGASIDDTKARLVVEGKKWNLVFYGKIENDGRCKIDINNLNIFNEGDNGKIRLEVIADNTIFVPWTDDFSVKTNKKVTVEVINRGTSSLTESKTDQHKVAVNVQVSKNEEINKNKEVPIISKKNINENFINEVTKNLKIKGITSENIYKNKSLFTNIILNNMKKHNIDSSNIDWAINEVANIINND